MPPSQAQGDIAAILAAMITLTSVSKDFGRGPVIQNVSLTIHPGEFICFLGASGSGKSTLMSLLMAAELPTSGSIMIDGADLSEVPAGAMQLFRRKLGIMFQDFKLFQTRTVAENIAHALEIAGMSDEEIEKRVNQLIMQFDLNEVRNSLASELSAGQKARTAAARAIAHSPLILLADEPTQSMDVRQATAFLRMLQELNAQGTTVVLATHDAALAETLNARVVVLEKGRIAKDAAPAERKQAAIKKKEAIVEEAIPEAPTPQTVKAQRRVKITAIRSE
jgi:cell division transport system ATP-binding protein